MQYFVFQFQYFKMLVLYILLIESERISFGPREHGVQTLITNKKKRISFVVVEFVFVEIVT